MENFYRIIVMAILVLGIASCQEDRIEIEGEVSQPENGEWTSFEQYGYVTDFTITSNSDWVIESEGDWFVLYETQGSGTSKIKMEIVDNNSDVRREGKLIIKFPQDESKNQVINIRQKSLADYDDNAVTISEGYGRYGVGYGYDATGNYASSASCKAPVFFVGKLIEDELLINDGSAQEAQKRTYTGSSVYDVSQKLSVNAGVDAKFGGFKGEVKASFEQQYTENQFCEFGIYTYRIRVGFRKVEYGLQDLKEAGYMNIIARKAIDGASDSYKGNEGIKKLIANYGTHVITKAYMGGRLDYSMAVDVSKISGSYDISAFLSAGYEGCFNTSSSVDEKYKQSYEKNKKNCFVKVRTLGGSVSAADILEQGEVGMKKWIESLSAAKPENHAMVDFDAESLIPIWELCEDKTRADAIKKYVETYVKNVGLTTSQVTKINIPTFGSASNATLVKTAGLSDGTPVVEICNEYIPNLSSTQRVTVVYPILAGVPQYRFGFFVGSSTLKPGTISWDETGYTYKEDVELPVGEVKTIYRQGLSITAVAPSIPENKIQNTTITDQFFNTLHNYSRPNSRTNYSLVKISNNIWTRVSLWSDISSDGMASIYWSTELPAHVPRWTNIEHAGSSYVLYNRVAANSLQTIVWSIPSDGVCNSLINYVNKEPSKIISKGVSGLEIALCGFWDATYKIKGGIGGEGSIWCGTGYNYMRITSPVMGVGSVGVPQGNSYGFPVRLVRAAQFKYY